MQSKMRKILAVLTTVALLCTVLPMSGIAGTVAAAENLVVNGDFESGDVGSTATNWKQYDASYPSLVSVEDAHTGSQAVKLSYRQSRFVLRQDVTVEENTDYTISLYYRYTTTTDTRVYRLGAYTTGSNGNVANGGGTLIDSTATEVDTAIANTEWTKLSYTFNSGSNTTICLGVSGISTTAKIYSADGFTLVDDITMEKVEAEPEVPDIPVVGDNLLTNGDFETGAITPWSSQSSQKCAISSNAHAGSYGATVPHRNTVYTAQQDITVEADTDYVVTLWYKSTNVSTANQMRVCVATTSNTNTAQYIAYTDLDSTKGTWTKVVFTFNSGSNTSLRLGIGGIATPAATETYLCVDDVVVAKKAVVEPSFDGYIYNGDFETGTLDYWTITNGAQITCDSANVASGSFAMEGTATAKYDGFVTQTVTVEANTDYTITFKAKLAASGGQIRLVVNGNGTRLNNDCYYFSSSTEWQTYQVSFNSGENTSVDIVPTQGVTGGGNIYYDDFVMTKVESGSYVGLCPEEMTSGADIRMMTYNVLVGQDTENGGYSWGAAIDGRPEKACAMINYYKPDVIALEEFSGEWYDYFVDNMTGYAFGEMASADSQNNGKLYTCIAYNTETVRLLSTELHGLTKTRWGKQGMRYVNVGFFEVIATGEKFIACATHTDAGALTGTTDINGDGVAEEGDGYWRQFQTVEIAEILNELSATHKQPVLCGGDYNCGLDGTYDDNTSYSKLTDAGLTDSTAGVYIDHIFYNSMVTPLYNTTVTDAAVSGASDHDAVFADFQFLDEYATPISSLMSGIKQQGRNQLKNGTLWLDFSASGIEFSANCEGDVSVTFNTNSIKNTDATYGGVYFTVIVDGVQKARTDCRITATGATTLKIAEGLSAGNHTFEIYRQTEHRGAEIGISAITFDGTLNTAPINSNYYIEFIGDSISTGYGALGNSSSEGSADCPLYQDATAAYPYLVAKELGVDFSDVAFSGIGAKYGYHSFTMQDVYPLQRHQYDQSTAYGFNREPNVIVIALGTNDIANQDDATLRKAGYQEMYDLVRAKNPNAKIIWIYNMMKSDDNAMIAELVEENGGSAAGLYSLQLTMNTSGAGWHPNAAGQQVFADELVAFINDNNLLSMPDREDTENLISAEASSVAEMTGDKLGVAFLFRMAVTGVTVDDAYTGNYENATVTIGGNEYDLLRMGAVLTNKVSVGTNEDALKLTNLGSGVIDIPARKICEDGDDYSDFAVRITNVPLTHTATAIYARPYYVIEMDGEEVTVYGDIVGRSYESILDVNNGELEW